VRDDVDELLAVEDAADVLVVEDVVHAGQAEGRAGDVTGAAERSTPAAAPGGAGATAAAGAPPWMRRPCSSTPANSRPSSS
jgi:hypothetical protein